jgi:Uma2 family endonuclease
MSIVQLSPVETIRVPAYAMSLEGFRRWAKSADFPQRGRISYIAGELFIDMSPEELETHNKIKTRTGAVLLDVAEEDDLGEFYGDRTLVTNPEADLSTEPDGTFVSWESLESGRVRLVPREGTSGQYTEIAGSPDMALEVVSISSVHKDAVELMESYYRAGVQEYWLIDARGEEVSFQIFVRGPSGFVVVPRRGGWVRSRVFRRSFRLLRRRGRLNLWRYALEVKPK